ncbi:MAG: RICIN domain-containing protein, partial [Pseudomonadales bacterium]
ANSRCPAVITGVAQKATTLPSDDRDCSGGLVAEEPANDLLPGEEIPEPCTDEDTRAECVGIAPEESEVQTRGNILPPLISFRLRNSGNGNCLRPVSVSQNARVVLGNCSGTASYWTPIKGQRFSSIKGTFGADWEYMLRNNHTHFCLRATSTTAATSDGGMCSNTSSRRWHRATL